MIQNINFTGVKLPLKTFKKSSPTFIEKAQRELSQECRHCSVCYYPLTCTKKGIPERNGHKLKITKDEITKSIDIRSNAAYPANVLSNLMKDPFTIDGIKCSSMEGFLQSLKISDPEMQKTICAGWGSSVKKAGSKNNEWKHTQTLYWQGKSIKRDSKEYQQLLKKAFRARLEQSSMFRFALMNTKGYSLSHSIGKDNPQDTILTKDEFVKILEELRKLI